MRKHTLKTTYLIGAGLAIAAAPALSAYAATRCDLPHTGPDARACAAAAQGPTELRRFIERTRAVYGLYYEDYARSAKPSIAAGPAQTNLPSSDSSVLSPSQPVRAQRSRSASGAIAL